MGPIQVRPWNPEYWLDKERPQPRIRQITSDTVATPTASKSGITTNTQSQPQGIENDKLPSDTVAPPSVQPDTKPQSLLFIDKATPRTPLFNRAVNQ